MKVMKNTSLLCVLIVVALAKNALALPYSTYGYDNGWDGYKTYNQDGIDLTVVFNVYDTVANPTEFTWNGGAAMPNTDRYVYAYQIINNSDSQDISLFNLLDKSGNALPSSLCTALAHNRTGLCLVLLRILRFLRNRVCGSGRIQAVLSRRAKIPGI